MKKYRNLYFDLDRTLWDYETNASEALSEIFQNFDLAPIFGSYVNFRMAFAKHNNALWSDFQKGKLKKETIRVRRFELALLEYSTINNKLAGELNDVFLTTSPRKAKLVPDTNEVLDYLRSKSYRLYILTNGFTQIQELKMKSSGLNLYFEKMFTSENTRSYKPKRSIFEYAIKSVNAKKVESLMIGDDLEADIIGAREFGIDQVYFNPGKSVHNEKITYEIHDLISLKNIL